MASCSEKCALLPPRNSSRRRRSSSPAHCGRLATPPHLHSNYRSQQDSANPNTSAIPSASTIGEALHFSASPVSFVNHRRYSVAPCPKKLPDKSRTFHRTNVPQRAYDRGNSSSGFYYGGGRRQSAFVDGGNFYPIKPSASSPQGFPSNPISDPDNPANWISQSANPNNWISSLHPLIVNMLEEQNKKIVAKIAADAADPRKLSFDSAANCAPMRSSSSATCGLRAPPAAALNKYELGGMSGAVSNEPIYIPPHHINNCSSPTATTTTVFQTDGGGPNGKKKVLGGTSPAGPQSPSAVRVPGMTSSPLPEMKNVISAGSVDQQKNPFYEVSNEYMRVAGYVQQFNRLFSIKKSPKSNEGEPNDAEVGGGASGDAGYKNSQTESGTMGNGVTGKPSHGTVYGRLWKEPTNLKRFKFRKQLLMQRTRACNLCLIFALIGIVLTVIEAELVANHVIQKVDFYSKILRYVIVFTTVVLLLFIVWYHAIEIKVCVIDSGAHDWRVAITGDRVVQLCIELLVCAVCPFPNSITVDWIVLLSNYRQIKTVQVPLDVVLSIPMFGRCYLMCRFMALHSRQFQDAATRSIASLNRVTVNFTFVLKTLMHEHPLLVLCSFTISFWIVMAWLLTQCERYDEIPEDNNYLNALWFIMITFKSVGYGDLVPNTYCGRVLAITTGIVGAAVSSALIAVIGMKLELSRAEKHVNNFMTDSKLTRMRKETAAMVLQHTWFIHKYRRLQSTKDEIKLRVHQRKFLAAINEFRKIKWDQRKLAEQGNALVDLAKLQNDMHTMIWSMQQTLDNLANQMSSLTQHINHLYELNILQHVNLLNNAAADTLRRQDAMGGASVDVSDKNVQQVSESVE